MGFTYDPKDARECLNEGSYDAELASVEETVSKAGNPMLKICWVIPWEGREWRVYEYIVNPSGLWKLKRIAKAWHMIREFDEARFDLKEHVKRLIVLKLSIELDAKFGEKNVVDGYEESSGQLPPDHMPKGKPPVVDDSVPF